MPGLSERPASLANFKGTIYISTRAFTERRFGSDAVRRCLQRVGAADAALLESTTAIGWYPVEPVLRYHHALQDLYGEPGDFALCEELGRFSAEWAFSTVLKVLLRFGSPHWLWRKQGSIWSRYHDSGRWVHAPEQPHHMNGKLYDFAVQDELFCARLRGWVQGAISLTGGKQVRVTEPNCRTRGDEFCEYDVHWA